MVQNRFFWAIFLAIFSILLHNVNCGPVGLPTRTTAVFHDSPDLGGEKVSFREDPRGWSNLPQLFSSRKVSPILVCVSGVWVIYGKQSYRTGIDEAVKLISGNKNCIPPSEDITEVASMQPVSPPDISEEGSIALFSETNFGSMAQIISRSEIRRGGLKQLDGKLASIGSIIIVGKTPWSLMSSSGKAMCLWPKPKENMQDTAATICYVIDLLSVRLADFHIDAVYPDCPGERHESVVANIKLSECKRFGTEKVETLKATAMMGRSSGGNQAIVAIECPQNNGTNEVDPPPSNLSPEEKAMIEKLIRIRISHDFENVEQILWPDREQDLWKTIPLDTMFDIAIATVPNDIISVPYLRRIREFTVFHLNEVCKASGNSSNSQKLYGWKHHRVINHMLGKCLKMVRKRNNLYKSKITERYTEIADISQIPEETKNYKFELEEDFDPVLETTWLVANYVMGLCHKEFEYSMNFWDNFVSTFHYLYSTPLKDRWTSPTQISPLAFRTILSGYGVSAQYTKMAIATTQMLNLTPNLEPFEKFEAL